jgi:hypothetical protein
MQQHVVKMFHRAYRPSSLQPSYALQLRDMDGLQLLVLDLYLQGDVCYFHQILL